MDRVTPPGEAADQAPPPRVLVVDSEPGGAETVANLLRQERYRVDLTADPAEALRAVAAAPYDVVLTELAFAEGEGPNLLAEVPRLSPTTSCIVLTGYASVEGAVEALRHGAYDFLVKPCVIEDLKQTVARAITQRRLRLLTDNQAEELRALNEELERRVQERTAELARANQQLGDALQSKDRFLATLSHELRTPLTPLRAGLDLLKQHDDPTLQPILETMERNLAQEGRLIDDLLDVARVTAGKMSIEKRPIDLHTLLSQAAAALEPKFKPKQLELTCEMHATIPRLLADPVRLHQIVANLLENAAKFTPAGGHIHLEAWPEAGMVYVRVSDDGPGIDPAFLPHVFEPFRQADSSSRREHGGLGLGLAVAHQIVTLHGGVMWAANREPGPGAVFTFRLPFLSAPAEQHVQSDRGPVRLDVLLVDDSRDTVEMLSRLLTAKGLGVRTALSAEQALTLARAVPPDVLITDIGMPGQDGYDLLRAFQTDPRLHAVPVVAATGYVGSREQERMAETGFAASLSKPFDLDELLQVLRRVSMDG